MAKVSQLQLPSQQVKQSSGPGGVQQELQLIRQRAASNRRTTRGNPNKRACSIGLLQTYLALTQNLESPGDFHLWAMISAVAMVMGRNVWFDMAYFKIYPNMYIVLTAPSGVQKTTAMNAAMGLLNKSFSERIHFTNGETTMEKAYAQMALIYAKSNVSPLTITSGELRTFLDSAGGNSQGQLLARLTNLYDNPDKFKYETKVSGSQILNNVCCNMLTCSTPEWLPSSGGKNFINSGYSARNLYIYAEKSDRRVARPKRPDGWQQMEQDILDDLEAIALINGEYEYAPGVDVYMEQWYNNPQNFEMLDDRMESYAARKQAHVIKLAMILTACMSDSRIINQTVMQTAIEMVNAIEPGMRKTYEKVGYHEFEGYEQEIMKQLMRSRALKRPDLMCKCGKIPPEKFQSTLNYMLEKRKIKRLDNGVYMIDELEI